MSLELGDLVHEDGIYCALKAKTKRQALQLISEKAAGLTGLVQRDVFDALQHRERLGSTGIGRGIAIPHVKLAKLKTMLCVVCRFDTPIDFDAIDGEPVDLMFLLLAPDHASGDHLKALARISRLLRTPRALERLRAAHDPKDMFNVLTLRTTEDAA